MNNSKKNIESKSSIYSHVYGGGLHVRNGDNSTT